MAWIGKAASVGFRIVGIATKSASSVSKVARFGKSSKAASEAIDMKHAGAGVYSFVANGKTYIGHTNNFARRIAEHARNPKFKGEISHITFDSMPSASKLRLRQAEQRLIYKYGGIPCRSCNPKLHNVINSIKP